MLPLMKNRWSVVVAGVVILLCLGVAYSWGVFIVPIQQDMGWGRTVIAVAVSILLFVFSLAMVGGGFCERRYGARLTALIGGILVGLGWMIASQARSPRWLYIWYGVVAGTGTGLCYISALSCGLKWFPEKKGLVTGIILFGFGIGTAFLSPVLTGVIMRYGWRLTMLGCGSLFAGIICFAAQWLRPAPVVLPTAVRMSPRGGDAAIDCTPLQMVKTRQFWLLGITYVLAMIAGMMAMGHLSAFMLDRGFAVMQAAFGLTVLAFFNGVGRIVFGYLSDRWGGEKTLLGLFVVMSGAMFVLYYPGTAIAVYCLAACIGICFGGFLAVYPPLTAEYFGTTNFSLNYGLVFIGYGSGCFIGPLLGGTIHDIAGSYVLAFTAAGFLALLGALISGVWLKPASVAGGRGRPVSWRDTGKTY